MDQVTDTEFLEDLKFFRWILYHHGESEKTTINSSNNDTDNESENGSEAENMSAISIESEDTTEREEIIGSLMRYHCEHGHGEIIAEELIIAKNGLEKNLHEILRSIAPHIDESHDLPSIRDKNDALWDFNRLFICLVYENKPLFVKGLELVAEKRPADLCTLLVSMEFLLIQLSSKINTDSACEILASAKEKLSSLDNDTIKSAIKEYDDYLPELKRTKPEKNGFCAVDLIESAKQKLCCHGMRNSNIKKNIDHKQCLDVLIDWNEKELFECDKHSHTALYYAIQYKNNEAIKKLLDKGVYIGMDGKSAQRKYETSFNMQRLHPKVLEEHFDSCISLQEDHIEIDFKNLIAPSSEEPHAMNFIEFMSDSRDYKHLIVHPLISSYVMLKWNRLACFIYTDFMQHLILMMTTIIYVLKDFSETNREIFGTFAILSTSIEAFISAGSLFWSFSKYYVMFLDVAWNSMKSLQLCAILLPAISASFYLMFRDQYSTESSVVAENGGPYDIMNKTNGETGSSFSQFGPSLLKTIVMSTGEFDASSSDYDLNVMTLGLFLCFVFLISTVFMNLMNGLAVGDTQKIQSNAEVVCMQQRCRILARFEDIFTNQKNWFSNKLPHVNETLEKFILESSIKENPIAFLKHPLNTKIYISPSRHVIIAPNRYKGYSYRCGNSFEDENMIKLYSWISTHATPDVWFFYKCLQMDRKIVRDIRDILDKKHVVQNGDNGKDHLKCQIANLENDVERVVELMKENEENTNNRYEEMLDLLRKMHEENKKYHEEVAHLKSLISSLQGPKPGSSSSKPSGSVDLHNDGEKVENTE
ncbi:uncharacterized protein LOC129566561 isoform X2 [Sitodiplosis mosellana]|uniref:uncharacterized protein LOC129566561 isoform X2 n=1 Tax=Sitodiplosis mosellana TaxID=263140 RepID=UPI0024448F25|nr:uncharacterized protein LOC129566561 isoform X2 [Sitodiplosis mosellana]